MLKGVLGSCLNNTQMGVFSDVRLPWIPLPLPPPPPYLSSAGVRGEHIFRAWCRDKPPTCQS